VSNIPFNDNVSIKSPQLGAFFCLLIIVAHQFRAKPTSKTAASFEKMIPSAPKYAPSWGAG
jgi:hypothetical protein